MTYDASGGVVSVSVPESRFSRREVDLLLESRRLEKQPRGSHGLTLAEATDPANQFAFTVGKPVRDFAASALRAAKDAYQKANPGVEMSDLLWVVERRE